jgi:hypothetical protein
MAQAGAAQRPTDLRSTSMHEESISKMQLLQRGRPGHGDLHDALRAECSADNLDSLHATQPVNLQLVVSHDPNSGPRSPFVNIENYSEERNSASNTAATYYQADAQKKPQDYERKNLERLEALKNKKAQELREAEEQREKTRKRQEKLKNLILKEAQENRRKKEEQKLNAESDVKPE